MTKSPLRPPIHTQVADKPTTLVPLAGSDEPAIIDTADFQWLSAAGDSPNWRLNTVVPGYAYVRCGARGAGKLETVARLLLGANHIPGSRIRYINGNRLDLRRSNLKLVLPKQPRGEIAVIALAFQRRGQTAFTMMERSVSGHCAIS